MEGLFKMVKVDEAELRATLLRLKEFAKNKDKNKPPKSTITYISMNKNLESTTKTFRKTQKALLKV